ncbi:MAG: RsmD family RNA methyltransferase [Mangrovibacterium sp.]
MRIVGGKYKGRQFNPGRQFKARPTTNMAKENLFNILQHRLDFKTLKILDLFSGTGSISFEFASRGCRDITSVETDFRHHRFIQEVIAKIGEKHIRAVRANAFRFLESSTGKFDLIFADPPFDHPRFNEVPRLVLNSELLAHAGLFILEHSGKVDFSDYSEWLELRRYGNVHFSFFRSPDPGETDS